MRLAKEVDKYVQDNCLESTPFQVSFIGYSLGGVIIRAALPYLKHMAANLFTFMSLSSPHLGLVKSGYTSGLFSAGLWFFKKWNGSKCLD